MSQRPEPVNDLRTPIQTRVESIVAAMGLTKDTTDLHRRIATFCRLNGHEGVLAAAEQTGSVADIQDRWAYTVAAYNNNLARLSHLYTLLHWTENSLRSHLDELLTDAIGIDWFRHPRDYLPPEHAARLAVGESDPWIDREDNPACLDGRCIATTYASGAAFLRETSFGTVKLVTINACYALNRPFLVEAAGNPIRRKQAKKLLESANQSRNLVAHSRTVHLDLNTYTKRVNKLNDLLIAMRFDLAKALFRWEQQHFVVADAYLKRSGSSGIDAVVAAWQTFTLND